MQFKIRCSQISRIMTEPRSKKDKEAGVLSKTTKSYVQEWLTQQIYGVPKPIESKEMTKGIEMEQEAIEVYALYKDDFLIKNERYFENEVIKGTPDIVTDEMIVDIKCPWDCYTFPLFDQVVNNMYYWQMQGYMELTRLKKAKVVYVLMNTPIDLQRTVLDAYDYTQLPLQKRVKTFDVCYNQESVDKIYERVEQIRKHLKKLKLSQY